MENKNDATTTQENSTPQMTPSVGRIVHYTPTDGGDAQAALIVGVNEGGTANLVTWNKGGTSSTFSSVRQGNGNGEWKQPARV